jgi:DNA-directed RNA polymerase subunit M/transcription elongation factor TFIIS
MKRSYLARADEYLSKECNRCGNYFEVNKRSYNHAKVCPDCRPNYRLEQQKEKSKKLWATSKEYRAKKLQNQRKNAPKRRAKQKEAKWQQLAPITFQRRHFWYEHYLSDGTVSIRLYSETSGINYIRIPPECRQCGNPKPASGFAPVFEWGSAMWLLCNDCWWNWGSSSN